MHKEQEDIELEKFAYDIAETLVSSLEKSAGIQTKVRNLTIGKAIGILVQNKGTSSFTSYSLLIPRQEQLMV